MKPITTIFLFLFSLTSYANINFIDISKISKEPKYIDSYNSIIKDKNYYNHWESKWSHKVSKKELVRKLQESYLLFNSITKKNTEVHLLLGDVAHYLYNLEDSAYYNLAIKNYKTAIEKSPEDYRGYWFLGNHYSLSNVPTLAIENFKNAKEILKNKSEQPIDFWDEYSYAAYFTNMPSTCIYAMDRVKSIGGKAGSLETQLGDTIRNKIKPIDKSKNFLKEDIWNVSQDEKLHFTCRPLGIKISVDSTWNTLGYNYGNKQSAFIINPPPLKNKKGQEIGINIAILMNSANDTDKLEDYVHQYVASYSNKQQINFSNKYNNIIAYEVRDSNLYKEYGGGHMYFIGIERNYPMYPGLLLESPAQTPLLNSEQYQYFRLTESLDRFKGKIFYAIMLDSCEDINDLSFPIFKTLFENQIIIE